ncbi:MAG: RNA polymerase sigma-70 factor [Bacteroidetes bacterium]|nr:MAG: RNA polymerase sigma-70 factor [Bacteroidota bacterium]
MMESPEELRARFCRGEREAVQTVFYQYYPMLCENIYRILPDRHLAEDLAQEVFVKCWRKRKDLRIEHSLPAYLRRMAIHEALYYLRRQKRKGGEVALEYCYDLAAEGDPLQSYYRKELRERIDGIVANLPSRCRKVFELSRNQGLSYREIAQELHITRKTVENHIARALQVLRRELKVAATTS